MSEAQLAMVSEWMTNGNINEFIKVNPNANRLKLVGISREIPPFAEGSLMIEQLIRSWKGLLGG